MKYQIIVVNKSKSSVYSLAVYVDFVIKLYRIVNCILTKSNLLNNIYCFKQSLNKYRNIYIVSGINSVWFKYTIDIWFELPRPPLVASDCQLNLRFSSMRLKFFFTNDPHMLTLNMMGGKTCDWQEARPLLLSAFWISRSEGIRWLMFDAPFSIIYLSELAYTK